MTLTVGCYHQACETYKLNASKRIKKAQALEFNDLLRTGDVDWLLRLTYESEQFAAYMACMDASDFVRKIQIRAMMKYAKG